MANFSPRKKIYEYSAGILINLSILSSEMHYGWTSPYLPILEKGNYTFRITHRESSYLVIIPLISGGIAAVGTSLSVDFFGRKKMILYSSLPLIASWILIGLASSPTLMYIGRFISGVVGGMAFAIVPMYLGEIAEPNNRGLLSSLCPISAVCGLLLINLIGSYLALDTAAFVSAVIPFVLLVAFPWMPESPYYYLMRGEIDKARMSLQTLRGEKDVSKELNRISVAVKRQIENKGKLLDLFTSETNRKALLIIFALRGFQQCSGSSAVTFYNKTVFEEANGFISSQTASVIFFSIQLILLIFTSSIVDRTGRKPLLILSLIGISITMLTNAIFLYLKNCTHVNMASFNSVPFIAPICYIFFYSSGIESIPFLLLSEIFPINVKAFAMCVMGIFFSILVIIVSQFFHWSKDCFGMHVPFFAFASSSVIGAIFVHIFVPETKGKTLEDIQNQLGRRRRTEVSSVVGEEYAGNRTMTNNPIGTPLLLREEN